MLVALVVRLCARQSEPLLEQFHCLVQHVRLLVHLLLRPYLFDHGLEPFQAPVDPGPASPRVLVVPLLAL